MARRRATRNRIGERADFDESEEIIDEEDVDDEEDDEEDDDEDGDEDDDEGGDEEEEEVVKPKKPVKKKAAAAPKRRTAKVQRMKAIWVILDNSGKEVADFPFSQKAEAESDLEKRRIDKVKGNYYLQLRKVPLE